jgi:O-antigen/teichoic acid export membrane protein
MTVLRETSSVEQVAALAEPLVQPAVKSSSSQSSLTQLDQRRRERVRRMGLTTLTAVVAQVVKLIAPLVTIPMTLQYLGEERFGLWMTVSSIVLMLGFSDLGLGNSLVTALARADGQDDHSEAVKLISSAMGILCLVALGLTLLTLAAAHFVNWARVFNVKEVAAGSEARMMVIVAVLSFAAGLPLGIVQKVQSAYQEGFQSNLWQCASSVLSMAALFIAVQAQCSLPLLILSCTMVPTLVLAANSAHYLGWTRPWLRPRRRFFDDALARRLLRTGVGYVLISLLMTIGYQCDNLILAHVVDLKSVTQYSVPARLASLLNMVPMMIYQPLWSATGEALARGDLDWARQQVARIQRWTVSLTLFSALLFVFLAPVLIHWFLGRKIVAPFGLMTGMGVAAVMFALGGPWFMVLNGSGCVAIQVRMYLTFTLVAVCGKLAAASSFGISGIPWITAVCYFVVVLPPLRKCAAQCLSVQLQPQAI